MCLYLGSNRHTDLQLKTDPEFWYPCYLTNQYARKRFSMAQYIEYKMQYARSTRMFYYIQSDFAVCRPAWFSGYSDRQSSAQWKMHHICQVVLLRYKQSWERWQMKYNLSTIQVLQFLCTVNILIYYCCTKPSEWMSANGKLHLNEFYLRMAYKAYLRFSH